VRPSACNDETVVYYVSGTDRDHLLWVANKIVDGKEVELGQSECQLVPAEHRVVCRIGRGTFLFAIDGNRIHGRLDLQDGTRYRVIEVERVR
jgi:glycine cleavage system regulatory protein